MEFREYESPCGMMLLAVEGSDICLCDWIAGDRIEKSLRRINRFLPPAVSGDDLTLLARCASQLDEYFAGERRVFDIPLKPCGTAFQRKVWKELQGISYGTTATYGYIASAVSLTPGVRAVASAIAANPLSILIPCHRIIGASGALTGYAGGIEAKEILLRLENPDFLIRQTVHSAPVN